MLPFFLISSVFAILILLHLIGKKFGDAVLYVTLFSVILKIAIGVLNKTHGPLPGADVDAVAFETVALGLSQYWSWTGIDFLDLTDRYSYSNVLAILFYVDGYSIILVPLFNTALTTFASYNVFLIANTLKIDKRKIFLIALILGLNPIIILYSAVPMREAPIYAVITFFFRVLLSQPRQVKTIWHPALLVSIVIASYLHIAFVSLALVLVLYGFNASLSIKGILHPRNLIAAILLALIFNFAITSEEFKSLPRVAKLLDSDTGSLTYESLEAAQLSKSRGEGAYTYPEISTGLSIVDMAIVGTYMTTRLVFSPFPWEIRSASGATIIKVIDLSLQVWLNFLAIRNLRRRDGRDKMVFLYMMYLLLSLLFGLNTVNDGVALRHRTKLVWFVALAAFSPRFLPRRMLMTKRVNA